MKGKSNLVHWKTALTILAVAAWMLIPIFGSFSTQATVTTLQDCPNKPLFADLTGTASGNRTPSGRAQFRERNRNELMVMVRSVDLEAGTTLNVLVEGTNVGQITLGRNGNGQIKLDAPSVSITEGTTITVANGSTTILSGTFACVARGGRRSPSPSPTVTGSPSPTPTVSPTVSPTASPTVSPSPSPTVE